jgi:hypothetical protein
MLTVETLIGNLLLQHNCVVVPSFGGFVAQRVPARLDELTSTMHPPKKSVLFNKQLISNDGLLVQAYAHHAKLNYSQAEIEVKNCVGLWEKQLSEGQRVSIDRVGILFLDKERNLSFEQDRFYNLLLESYGLGSIHFVSVEDVQALVAHDQIQLVATASETETPIIALNGESIPVFEATNVEPQVVPIKKKRNALKYAAAACALPILFYSFWIPMKTDALESGIITFSDFNPFQKHTEAHYKPAAVRYNPSAETKRKKLGSLPENIDTYSYELDEDTYIPVKVSKLNEGTQLKPVPSPITSVTSKKAGWVIVGSYSTRENAQKQLDLVNSLGFSGEILEKDGKIRVSAGSGNQFGIIKAKLSAQGIDCWLLD